MFVTDAQTQSREAATNVAPLASCAAGLDPVCCRGGVPELERGRRVHENERTRSFGQTQAETGPMEPWAHEQVADQDCQELGST